jgi:hypothetical protein
MEYIVLGIVFIIVPAIYFIYTRYIILNGIESYAAITTTGRSSWVSLSYTIDGQYYESNILASIPTRKTGEKIMIYYHKNNPKKIVPKGSYRFFWDIIMLVFIIGGVLNVLRGIYGLDIL